MSLKKFIFSRVFLINLLIAIGIIILLIISALFGLKKYTHHGLDYPVPNLIGLHENEVSETVSSVNLKYEIIDSVYINSQEPGSVIDQVPKPGFKVKQERTILITINAKAPEKVSLPKLRYISFRQAQVQIENRGLQLGEVTYKPSEFNMLVLSVFSDSTEVFEGDELSKGAIVDLEIGRGSGYDETSVPDLTGLNIEDAKLLISDALLNQGVIIYDESIINAEDSINAKIWRQLPDPKTNPMIEPGKSVDIWVTIDKEKLNSAIEK